MISPSRIYRSATNLVCTIWAKQPARIVNLLQFDNVIAPRPAAMIASLT